MAGRAMGIATTGSVLGTLIGMFCLALFTPMLGDVALKFGAYEFFWLALFGVIISGTLDGQRPAQGLDRRLRWACSSPPIGQDGIHAYERFTFGYARPRRRHPAGAGAGRRLRLRRDADGDAGADADRRRSTRSTR